MASSRDLDIVLLGTTGYTGKLCAEHIVQHLPSDLKWGIAGRSAGKLEDIKKQIKLLNPDRLDPEILVVNLQPAELDGLSKKTRVLINCVGPYHLYSTPVVEACANNGTHYLDVTGETPWVREIVSKYHVKAKSTGALMIPSAGVESGPPDILAWALVKSIQERYSVGVKDMIIAIHEMKASGPSGGTLSTILNVIGNYSFSDLIKANDPFCLAYDPRSQAPKSIRRSTTQKLFGIRFIPELGNLTSSPAEMCDAATMHRSSTMMPKLYGRDYQAQIHVNVRNPIVGILIHIGFRLGMLALLLPPVRWLARNFIYAPGQGPTKQDGKDDRVEYRGIAIADQQSAKPSRALGILSYENGPYPLSGLLLAEAAMVILSNDAIAKEFAGFSTPAVLGQDYVDRLDVVGVSIQTRIIDT
ncbi:Saccharopine dehydrogenase-domain-containing protein [Whalleya microplaca]|nr:Saccharopine dehydrogenase-domain-containing protein [Whalleya microplaca]